MRMHKMRALRDMDYRTRRLKAGDVFDVPPGNDARDLKAINWAEDAPADEVGYAPRRRLKPQAKAVQPEPKAKPEAKAEPKPEPKPEPLEEKTVPELREMAEQQELDLPSGYIRKDELIDMLQDTEEDENDAK